jgi:chromosome segregation ATPase
MRGSKGFEIKRWARLGVYLCAVAGTLFFVCGCGEQLTRMEDNQIKLQAMVAANARELATLSSQVHAGTAKLGEGIQNLDTQAQGIAAGVQTVQSDQRQLQETVVAGHLNLGARADALRAGQQSLAGQVTQVQDTAQRTVSDLTALAQHQAGLRETVLANQQELNTHMGVVVSNQQGIQAGVVRLHEADESLARSLASVAGKQDALSATLQDNNAQLAERLTAIATTQKTTQDSIAANHEQVGNRLADLAQSQQRLQAGVETLDGKMTRMNEDLAGAASTLQQRLATDHDTVTSRIAGLATGQQDLQTRIDVLNAKADKAASDSETAVASLQETLRAGHEVVAGQMAAGLQNQQTIRTAVQDLHSKTDALAGNLAVVATEQATAKGSARVHHDEIITAMAGLSDGHQSLRSGIEQIGNKSDTMASELAAAAQRQNTMQQTIVAGNEALAAHAAVVADHHRNTNAAIADLGVRTQQVSTELGAMASAQDAFRRQQSNHNEAMTTRMTGFAEGQKALRGQVDLLTATTSQTALSMLTLNNSQATFQQAMQAGMNGLHERADQTAMNVKGMIELNSAMNQAIAAQAARMTENQQTMKTDIARMAGVVDRAYADLTAVSLAQDTLQSALATRSDEISGRVARLDNNQKDLAESLNVLTATAGQTALDVMGLATGHAELNRTIRAGNDAIVTRTAALADNQKTLGSQLDVLTATTSQTATDVIGASDRQNALAGMVRAYSDSATGHMAKLAENQQRMQSDLEVLTATAGQTALDVIEAAERQTRFAKAVQSHNDSTDVRMAKLDENQQKMQSGLDAVAATSQQTAQDLVAVTGQQDALALAIQSHDESVIGRIAKLDENQQKTQGGIETVATTAGQAVRDIATLSEIQGKSDQTAQAGRSEVTVRLTEIAQGQQSWIERFDAAQTRIQALADGIATLDQQVARLQGVLQTGAATTSAALDANGQQRQQFEAKIAQDVQAMIDALSQLRQTQAQLQEQMSQVHKSTQNQADTLKTTIEQLKAAPTQQPPVEVKVGDATKLVEPVVVQTGE